MISPLSWATPARTLAAPSLSQHRAGSSPMWQKIAERRRIRDCAEVYELALPAICWAFGIC
eukprot:5004200-Alexandrium_andersonii.AAC.1